MIFKSEKFIITNKGMLVRKGYSYENLFKTNVIIIVINDENSNKKHLLRTCLSFIIYDMIC